MQLLSNHLLQRGWHRDCLLRRLAPLPRCLICRRCPVLLGIVLGIHYRLCQHILPWLEVAPAAQVTWPFKWLQSSGCI